MLDRPIFIASEIYRNSRYGAKHPLSIPRVSATVDLIRSLGWLEAERYVEGPVATPDQLHRFHDPDYVAALQRAEHDGLGTVEMDRYNIGRNGNPIYAEVFRRPATAAGSSILAARLVAGGGTVHSPAGGTHHGQPARASGFCYLNDPVLGILALLDQGLGSVAYVDLDAHHGDGVEDAFRHDPRVTILSVHEAGRWPRTGMADHGGRAGIVNIPVPPGFNDDEFFYVLENAILPVVESAEPDAIMIQCGVDSLADDPLSGLNLSNGVYPAAVKALLPMAPRRIVLGGGGYNPYAVARAWTLIWGAVDDRAIPTKDNILPEAAQAVLRAIPWHHSMARQAPSRWFDRLLDPPNRGPIRENLRGTVRLAMRGGSVCFKSES